MGRNGEKSLRVLLAFVIALGAVVAVATSAVAEINPQPRNADGVVGVATGSQSDAVRTSVWAIEQIGNRVYVGGKFTQVTDGGNQVSQPYLAAFSARTGEWISSFRPNVNNSVNALDVSPDGSTLFVGGDFTTVNGQNQRGFAALNPTTGATTSFSGRVTSGSSVRGLDVQGGWVYLVGTFFQVRSGGQSTSVNSAARFSLANGLHDQNWRPNISGGRGWDIAASSNADRVYMVGFFTVVNGESRPGGFVAVSASSGQNIQGTEPFRVNARLQSQYAQAVEVNNGLVWVAGSEHYVYVMNEGNLGLKVFHLSNRTGDFQDLEVVGNRVYAGCHCRVGTSLYTRFDDVIPFPPTSSELAQADEVGTSNWILAFDATTGVHVDSFNPLIRSTGPGVWAIHGAPDGCLWVGGTLHRSNEQPINNLVRMCDGNPPDPTDNERPSTPGAARVTDFGDGYVDLAWNTSTDNVGVAGYRVFNAANNSELLSSSNPFARLSAADGSYGIYVRAFDAAGNLSWRSGIRTVTIASGGGPADTARPSPPGMPRIVNSGNGFVDLEWNPATDNVGVVGYRLYDLNNGNLLIDVTDTSARLNLAPGTYRIYAKAYDAAGNESWRSGARTVNI